MTLTLRLSVLTILAASAATGTLIAGQPVEALSLVEMQDRSTNSQKAQAVAQAPAANPAVIPANPAPATPSTPSTAPAAEPLPATESLPAAEPLVLPDDAVPTTNYSDDGMSLDLPAAWNAEATDDGLMISNVTTVESELVATQVVRMAAPPGPVVNANIDSFIDEGSAVGRYQSVTIDGQDALVMWLSDRPDSLESAIATFIGYGDETILLFSRYAPTNETAEDNILRLHTSFTNLLASAPAVAEPATEDVEEAVADEDLSVDAAESAVEEAVEGPGDAPAVD